MPNYLFTLLATKRTRRELEEYQEICSHLLYLACSRAAFHVTHPGAQHVLLFACRCPCTVPFTTCLSYSPHVHLYMLPTMCCFPKVNLYMLLSTCCFPHVNLNVLFSSCCSPRAALHLLPSTCCFPHVNIYILPST
jgi:hypothetical protein